MTASAQGQTRRLLRLAREHWGLLLTVGVVTVPIGLTLTLFLIGIPVVGFSLHRLARSLVGMEPERNQDERGGKWAATFGVGSLFTVIGAMTFAANAVDHMLFGAETLPEVAAVWLAAVLAPGVTGLLLAPLLFSPFVSLTGRTGLHAPAASFEVAARLGTRRAAATGALAGALYGLASGLAYLTLWLMSDSDPWVLAAFSVPVGAMLGVPCAAVVLADGYLQGLASRPAEDTSGSAASARVRALVGLALPVSAVLVLLVAAAAVSPLPMSVQDPLERGFDAERLASPSQRVRIEGTELTVRLEDPGILIEAEDGGGVGAIETPFPFDPEARLVVFPAGDDHAIVVSGEDGYAYTLIDSDGVRLDDSMTHRVFSRLGRWGSLALGLGLLSLALLVFVVGASFGEARTMTAPKLDAPPAEPGLNALEGRIRLAEGSSARFHRSGWLRRLTGVVGGTLRIEGQAWIEAEGGEVRFQLSEAPIHVLGTAPSLDWDGASVVLLSRFDEVGPASFREASVPLPEDARLVLGQRGDAADALAGQAVRVGSRLAALAVVATGLADVILVVSLSGL